MSERTNSIEVSLRDLTIDELIRVKCAADRELHLRFFGPESLAKALAERETQTKGEAFND